MKREVRNPVRHGYALQQAFLTLEEVGNGNVEILHGRGLDRFEVQAPAERIGQALELGEGHLVVNLHRIAPGGDVEREFRDRSFEPHDGVGLFCGVGRRNAGQLQHARHVRNVLFAGFDSFRVVSEIVIFFGESEAALVGLTNHGGRIFEVLPGGEIEEHVHADAMQARYLAGEVAEILHRANAVEFRLKRRNSLLIDGVYVHAGSVVVANLLGIGVAIGRRGGFLEDPAQNGPITLRELAEPSPRGLVGWYRIVLQPGSARVLVEVIAGVGTFVDRGKIEPGGSLQVRRILRQERDSKGGGKRDAG